MTEVLDPYAHRKVKRPCVKCGFPIAVRGMAKHLGRCDGSATPPKDRGRQKKTTTLDKILARTDRTAEGCWLWSGQMKADGYGQVSVANRNRSVHRVVYELLVGPVPDGLQLDHLCRVRHCCNPEHLEPVTNRENIMRGLSTFALTGRCRSGRHQIAGESDVVSHNADGRKTCRECARERSAARDQLMGEAANLLGISSRAYRAQYGSARSVAQRILATGGAS